MKKGIIVLLMLFMFFPATESFAQKKQITSYYPSPLGKYDRLRLIPRAALSGGCDIGTFYVETGLGIRYCRDVSGSGVWGEVPGVWHQEGSDIYPTDQSTADLRVGIGTTAPDFRLTVNGSMFFRGVYNTGLSLPSLGAGIRLFWYPRKAAFRAGAVSGAQWDDALIGAYSTVLGGLDNTANGPYSVILGGWSNAAGGDYAVVSGGSLNTASGTFSVVSGGVQNVASGDYAVVSGGDRNRASGDYAVVTGGQQNVASGDHSVVTGGRSNTASGDHAVVTGGNNNTASGPGAVVSGGSTNRADGDYTTITGGLSNRTDGDYAVVSGGNNNRASGDYAIVSGGNGNTASGNYSIVNGGTSNTASGLYSVVLGGVNNMAQGDHAMVGGRNMHLNNSADRTFVWGYAENPTTISTPDAFIVYSETGNLLTGFDVSDPAHPLQMASGARIQADGNICTAANICLDAVSDMNLKKDITPLHGALGPLLRLKGVSFKWRSVQAGDKEQVGFIAQDVEKVFPEWITQNTEGHKILNIRNAKPFMVEALREMNSITENVLQDNDKRMAELNSAFDHIEAQKQKIREQQEMIEKQKEEIKRLKGFLKQR